MFVIALQVPLRAVKIHLLLWNACPSQKTSQQAVASMTSLRNASRESCGFFAESERIRRDRKLLVAQGMQHRVRRIRRKSVGQAIALGRSQPFDT